MLVEKQKMQLKKKKQIGISTRIVNPVNYEEKRDVCKNIK